jgi:biopolymer transport protein ExbD
LASWDVFHADRLELERGLSAEAIRAARADQSLHDDDLVRPAGTTAGWLRLADVPELLIPADDHPARRPSSAAGTTTQSATIPGAAGVPAASATGDFEVESEDFGAEPAPGQRPTVPGPTWLQLGDEPGDVTFPVIGEQSAGAIKPSVPEGSGASAWLWAEEADDEDEDEPIESPGQADARVGGGGVQPGAGDRAADSTISQMALPASSSARDWKEDRPAAEAVYEADFTLSRSGPATVEELDLAPMVDVAFQLVLFFMVTATTVLYKTLEIPKPTADPPPGAVAQGHSRSLDDFKDDYVLVEIDPSGAMKVDHEPVASEFGALAERLRRAREKTGRKAMLLSADFATPHRNAVMAYDAANDIGMGIAIARPQAPQGAGPSVFPTGGRPPGAARAAAAAAPAPPKASPPSGAGASDTAPFE